jgi:hypothetical protein
MIERLKEHGIHSISIHTKFPNLMISGVVVDYFALSEAKFNAEHDAQRKSTTSPELQKLF